MSTPLFDIKLKAQEFIDWRNDHTFSFNKLPLWQKQLWMYEFQKTLDPVKVTLPDVTLRCLTKEGKFKVGDKYNRFT